jgi:hypothetical protein
MSNQTLRDRNYNIIGYIETRSDGTRVGKDKQGRIKGYYDPKRNQTKDSQGRLVANADVLSSLITSAL